MRSIGLIGAVAAAVLCLAGDCAAEAEPQELFAQANALYAQESYEEALRLYEDMLSAGWEAPELYYNAANCHLRLGRIGVALLLYRRAQRLAPGDDDVRANLAFIRSLAEGGSPQPEGSRLLGILLAPHRVLSTDGAALAASISGFILAGFLCLRVINPRRARLWAYCAVVAAAGLAASSASLGAKLHEERAGSEAVVVVRTAEVRSGPGDEFVVQTSLGEGAEVKVKRTGNQWIEISLGPEFAGWVRSGDVEII